MTHSNPAIASATSIPAPQVRSGGAPAAKLSALAKGLRALDLLVREPSIGATDLARALEMNKGAASRILKTLAEHGFAVVGPGRRYQASPLLRTRDEPQITAPGPSIRERALPLLQRLMQETEESATLAVRADDQVLYLARVETDHMLRASRPVGTLAPLHCTALGKVFLAFCETGLSFKSFEQQGRVRVTEETLRNDLDSIVKLGYSVDDEIFALGVRCVAAPLRDRHGRVIAAIGIAGPSARIPSERLSELGEFVRSVAQTFKS